MPCLIVALLLLFLPLCATAAGPTEVDFFREMLAPGATDNTAKFNAYYKDAFVIDKLKLLLSFPKFARQAGKPVRALLIIGPAGPLWTYQVITLVEENSQIRCNFIVMPHARITGKSTGLFSKAEIEQFLGELQTSPLLTDPGTTPAEIASSLPDNDLGDFRFNLLVAGFKGSGWVRIGEIGRAHV